MAELTKAQAAAMKARGVKASITPKHVKVSEPIELSGVDEIATVLREMAEAQQRSQQILIETLNQVVAAIEDKDIKSPDMKPLIEALKGQSVTESNTPYDYQVDFERDQRGLMKPGIRFTAIPKVLN